MLTVWLQAWNNHLSEYDRVSWDSRGRGCRTDIKRPPSRLADTFPNGNAARLIFHVLPWPSIFLLVHHKATTAFLFKNGGGGAEGNCCVELHVSQAVSVNKNVLLVNLLYEG